MGLRRQKSRASKGWLLWSRCGYRPMRSARNDHANTFGGKRTRTTTKAIRHNGNVVIGVVPPTTTFTLGQMASLCGCVWGTYLEEHLEGTSTIAPACAKRMFANRSDPKSRFDDARQYLQQQKVHTVALRGGRAVAPKPQRCHLT